MTELLQGPVDGVNRTFKSLNAVGRHLLFIAGLYQVQGLHYTVTDPYTVTFAAAFTPQPNSDGAQPPLALVHQEA